jgi:multicomponent Na+:H+ antiporter subunit C
MESVFALSIGALSGIAVYLFLARDLPRVLIGFVLFGSAANLAIFAAGRIGSMVPPIVEPGAAALAAGAANPLPQALILTAIVIGFGLAVFALMLIVRGYAAFAEIDNDSMREAEPADAVERAAGSAPEAPRKKAA